MKLRNILKTALLSGITAFGFASCDSDIDPVYVLPSDDMTLGGATGDIILTPDNPQALAMTIYWSGDGQLALSDTLLQAPVNAAEETIQLSTDEQFSSTIDLSVEKGVRSRQFLCEELNSLLGRLGYTADEKAPLFIRVRSVLSANINPTYSSVLKVMVQSYRIHLILGTVLDKDWNETAMQLASPDENGIYQGFMGVNGWTNWWFREANNIVWGNLGQEGMTFHASSADDHWNFWFPDPSGCYFTTVNTVEGWWSALHIDNLSVAGDLTGEMTYNQRNNQWTLPINLPSASTVSITVTGYGSLYSKETTDMGPAVEKNVAFSGNNQNLVFGENGSTITLDLPAGETNLLLDLSNPMELKIAAGNVPDEPTPEAEPYLYFSGVVDWNGFDDYISLYDESTKSYGGAHWIASEWGYRAYPKAEWDVAYKGAEGATPLSGSLILAESGNDGNIPQPENGLYVMDFNMSALTYTLTEVNKVTFTGLNDDWSEHTMIQSTDNPEVFTGEFIKTANTPWGVKVLINGDWGLFFGGGAGKLKLGHSDATTGFDGDNDLTIGETYILTVDLGKQTYSYSLK
ncbi:DUF5114 domain-containing protein [Muribaculaceae bacterium Isolate-039 (Harlan)]|jgi:hypothetical protein|uniref:DUF5114 domain-containing protein n=3 Tax=root TaxID=1 RepID=A0A2V1IVU7_9BACT|nr:MULTISPECIES: DUF5114 domain-containing protein [Bacteroidales]ROS85551.1 DUF5114 domain-containing protein [Muribaculaceae bacterium Isolate-039 (Harlan)]ROS90591.1 DUF5114 domain-containing protein [Muribaculaceae bacterium Isolate-043 (Harlan)]MYM13509.1 DUF5114 domain-containing protein [Muribaculum intestinale]PWB06592.1 DUF5114 domain-containing protein [Paramuribaculum intestinale]TGX80007.1 DUF5114 domain-containing protein [Muribaculum intestinale]